VDFLHGTLFDKIRLRVSVKIGGGSLTRKEKQEMFLSTIVIAQVNPVFGISNERVIFVSIILSSCLFILGFFSGLISKIKKGATDFSANFCIISGVIQSFVLLDLFFNCTEFGHSVGGGIYIMMFFIPIIGMLIVVFGTLFLWVFVVMLLSSLNLLPFAGGYLFGLLVKKISLFINEKLNRASSLNLQTRD
jgi:hypothetical protein